MQFRRTDSADPDFLRLVGLLDAELARIDQADHGFYSQHNTLDPLKYVIVALKDEQLAGCGALKEYATDTAEIKRMFTMPEMRGLRVASGVLLELERWAFELGYSKCFLETGKRLPDAIRLYERNGYVHIDKYGPYKRMENSFCFKKDLRAF